MKYIKLSLFTAAALLAGTIMYGQARSASVMIDNENRNAVMISIDQPENITKEALQQRMERSGLKERSRNGIVKYKGVTLSEISNDKVDIYTKLEKGPNNSSVLYMAVSRGYNNFTNDSVDSTITQNVKTFLESFTKDANMHSADVSLGGKIDEVAKEEKLYQKLLDEQQDLQKKKMNIENRLTAIQAELGIKLDNINKKKTGVEDAKAKRTSGQ
jgi:hypothetical protein